MLISQQHILVHVLASYTYKLFESKIILLKYNTFCADLEAASKGLKPWAKLVLQGLWKSTRPDNGRLTNTARIWFGNQMEISENNPCIYRLVCMKNTIDLKFYVQTQMDTIVEWLCMSRVDITSMDTGHRDVIRSQWVAFFCSLRGSIKISRNNSIGKKEICFDMAIKWNDKLMAI